MFSLQFFLTIVVIGLVLYVFNDWRTHRTHAAPEIPVNSPAIPNHSQSAYPLDQGVSGTVQVNPDGTFSF
jgi:hypothetical protein